MVEKITRNEFYKVMTMKKAIVIFGSPQSSGERYNRIINSLKRTNSKNNGRILNIELDAYDPIEKDFKIYANPTIIEFENGKEKGRIENPIIIDIILDLYEKKQKEEIFYG